MPPTPFADLLVTTAGGGARGDDRLEAAIARALGEARGKHPAVALGAEDFVRHLARHLPRTAPPLEALVEIDAGALFLCCAAARADAAAVAALDRGHFDKARVAIRAIRGSDNLGDDIAQRLREVLFLPGKDGQEPKIAKYGGRGDLGGWLRTVAMRIALEIVGPTREIPSPVETFSKAAEPGDDPELELIKGEYGARVRDAIGEGLRALPEGSRRDVRRYYFEAMGVEAMAEADGVAPSTISRRLAKARDLLLKTTREILQRKLVVSAKELDSILRLVRTELEITRGALAEREREAQPAPRGRSTREALPPNSRPRRRRKS